MLDPDSSDNSCRVLSVFVSGRLVENLELWEAIGP